ncbi:putative ORFan [Tupanvirus deep ocean]|uniref:ORFan n=2 Tax=Tupanvirus TaxID=2094720 RepID=A0AC62A8P8_9VIRU|nr:putative ORFan [Tupanvirus deep ocean]QKU34150.1 putative ORFan [Tupanvirus deep ocean]
MYLKLLQMSTTIYKEKILAVNYKYVTLSKFGTAIKFGECNKIDKTSDLYNSCLQHSNKNIKPLAWIYLGMGHNAVVIDDGNEFYHFLHVGGSNDWERIARTKAYHLYKFDEPSGKMNDLNNNTFIYPNDINMVEAVEKIYNKLAYGTDLLKDMEKFDEAFNKAITELKFD